MDRFGGAPLKGVFIVDLTNYWAGPHAVRIMADFGAEVVKVEYVKRLCVLRGAKKDNKAYDKHPMWHQVNRNRYSVTLDLKEDRDREAFKDLIRRADVVVDNFRGGFLDSIGLGYNDLVKIKPDLIMVSMSAFGDTGPYRSYSGVGGSIEAVSGIQSLTGYEKDGKRLRIREMDVLAGVAGACAIMTALMHRQRTGEGQKVDLSQMEAATHTLIGEHLLEYVMNGSVDLPKANRHRRFAPHGCYRCKDDDKWVAVAVRSDAEWQRFCDVLEHPELKDDRRFADRASRLRNHGLLDELIEKWTIRHTHIDVMQKLQDAGIPAGAVLNVAEISEDPHLKERGFFLPDPDGGARLFPGCPFRMSGWSGEVRRRGPDLGEHNRYVFMELLGRSEGEVPEVKEEEIGTGYDPE